MKTIRILCAFILILGIFTGPAFAKDLKGTLGVGFNSQFGSEDEDLDSISGKYWINNELAVQGLLGFKYSEEYDKLNMGGRVYFKIKDEENLHVDVIAGLGFTRFDPDQGNTDTATWINAGIGIEYFFSGLPNLGFSTEVGLTFMDHDDGTTFGTTADSFVGAGIHYYFDFLTSTVKKPVETE